MQTSSEDSLGKSSKTRLPVNAVAGTAHQNQSTQDQVETTEIRVNTVFNSTEIRAITVSLSGHQVPSTPPPAWRDKTADSGSSQKQ